jgi:hypothetical protein
VAHFKVLCRRLEELKKAAKAIGALTRATRHAVREQTSRTFHRCVPRAFIARNPFLGVVKSVYGLHFGPDVHGTLHSGGNTKVFCDSTYLRSNVSNVFLVIK